MALVVADRVKETTTSVGTSTINLAGAEDNFETFVTGVGTGNTTYYAIVDKGNSEFEVGIGTVTSGTPDTLSRDTVLASSNSDALVNFSTGEKDVFCTQPADKAVYLDSSGQLVIDGTSVTATATELNYVDGVTSAIQTQLDSKLNLSGGTMTGALTLSGAPTADNHATTKIYVDDLIAAGIHYHDPVRVESPDSAGNLNATYDNGTSGVGATLTNNGTQAALVIDGVTLATSDRVLIYNQTNAFENGIYTVTDTGSASTNWVLTRATDADSYGVDNDSLSEGTSVFVLEGDDGSGEVYACTTTGTITFGTTAINFSQIGRSAVITGNGGITVTGNEISANVNATVQTTGANSVTSTASRTYAVQVDGSNDLVVNVPWVDTDTNTDTTYTAGTGLTLSGTQFSVQDNYVLNTGDSIAGQLSVTSSTYPPLEVTRDAGAVTTGNYGSLKLNTITSGTPANGLGSYAGFFVDDVIKGSVGFENDGSFHILNASDADIVTVSSTGNITVAGTVDGRDIAADGTKLDGIESGATADQTASEILTAIKTVDGSGSGLDADTVDGIQGASFLRSDQDDTTSGSLTIHGNGSKYLEIKSTSISNSRSVLGMNTIGGYLDLYDAASGANTAKIRSYSSSGVQAFFTAGNVGIGTASPTYKLDVNGPQGTVARINAPSSAQAYFQANASSFDIVSGNSSGAAGPLNIRPSGVASSFAMAANGTITIDKDLYLDGWTYQDVAGQNFVLKSDTATRNTFEWQQGSTRIWTLDLQSDGDLNFSDAQGGNYVRIGDNRILTTADEGSGNGLDADTVDGLHASSFLTSIPDNYVRNTGDTITGTLSYSTGFNVPMWRHGTSGPYVRSDGTYLVMERGSGGGGDKTFYINNFSQIYTSVPLRLNNDSNDVLNFTANSTNDNRGISFNGRTALSADYNDGWLRLNNAQEFSNGTYSPKRISSAEQIVAGTSTVTSGGQLVVSNTTNPYLSFHEGATRRFYIQYLTTDNAAYYNNQESTQHIFNGTGTSVRLLLRTSGTDRGSVYANTSNNVGFLDSDGNWAYRHQRDSNHRWYINNSQKLYLDSTEMILDQGTSSTLTVKCDDGGRALIRATGDAQGTGAIEVGQSNSYGGGISYNGDGSPAFVNGEGADRITFYRLSNGTRSEVFSYSYNDSNVEFNGALIIPGQIYHQNDTNTYIQFHNDDQWRVVTGGSERLEVNNTNTTVQNNLIVNGNTTLAQLNLGGKIIVNGLDLSPNFDANDDGDVNISDTTSSGYLGAVAGNYSPLIESGMIFDAPWPGVSSTNQRFGASVIEGGATATLQEIVGATIVGGDTIQFGNFDHSTSSGARWAEGMQIDPLEKVTIKSDQGDVFLSAPNGAVIGAGVIGQVKQSVYGTATSYAPSAGTWADTPLSVTVSAFNSDKKMLIFYTAFLGHVSAYNMTTRITRTVTGGSPVAIGNGTSTGGRPVASGVVNSYNGANTDDYNMLCVSNQFLDSPNAGLQVTYTLQVAAYSGQTIYLNRSHVFQANSNYDAIPLSSLIVMEVNS